MTVDELAQEIRRVDGNNNLGAGALAEALMPFVERAAYGPLPQAWMRRWAFNGEKPAKERNENGRMAWPSRHKFRPVTEVKLFDDDVPLFPKPNPPLKDPHAQL